MSEEQVQEQDWRAEHHRLQVRLDDELQKIADERTAHATAIDEMRKAHGAEIASQIDAHKAELASLASQHEAVIAAQQKAHEAHVAELSAQHQRAMSEQQLQHAVAVAELKANVLVPAMRDLHARQQADLAAKHEAELEKLAKA